ncbi:hypothetical protein Glove_103g168 [Diversispora epigaea]|uniref:Uncharacterized protein n=1 Tax=Diversispora epigaea TaxID=1348612 RepID=A0A397JAA1_9GLOM|nr:hypothetical protein Glove_103g168 [Diversispora epigaea]
MSNNQLIIDLLRELEEYEIKIINLEQRDKEKIVTKTQSDLSTKDISYEINSNNTEKITDISFYISNSNDIQFKINSVEELVSKDIRRKQELKTRIEALENY